MRTFIALVSLLTALPILIASPIEDVPFTLTESVITTPGSSESDANAIDLSARQVVNPAPTISFYAGTDCLTGGYRYSIVDRGFGVCQSQIPPQYLSLRVDNPSGAYLPYTLWVGTCAAPVAVPMTNRCYNISPAGTGWMRQTGGMF